MAKITRLLEHMIIGIEKASGRTPDTVVVQNDTRAEEVREALTELGRDLHVIADDETSPKSMLVVHSEDLAKWPGGGNN